MNGLKFMPFDLNMLEECIDLYIDVFAQKPWFEENNREDVERLFLNFHQNNKFVGYVVKKDDGIIAVSIGFLKPWIKGEEYYIDQFFVDYHLQGQGVGTFFLNEIKNDLMKKHINAMILLTEKEYPAFEFYLKNGFENYEAMRFLAMGF